MTPVNADDLRAMPSSLNDACRKLDIAADEIERLRVQLAAAEARNENVAKVIAWQRVARVILLTALAIGMAALVIWLWPAIRVMTGGAV